MILEKETLIKIEGGGLLSATLLNTIFRGVGVIVDLGRSLGSALRRINSGTYCEFKS